MTTDLVKELRSRAPCRVPCSCELCGLLHRAADALEADPRFSRYIEQKERAEAAERQRDVLARRLRILAQKANVVTSYWRHGNRASISDEALSALHVSQMNAEDALANLPASGGTGAKVEAKVGDGDA